MQDTLPFTVVCIVSLILIIISSILILLLRNYNPLKSRCYPLLMIEAGGLIIFLVAQIIDANLKNSPDLLATWIVYLMLIFNCSIKLVQVFRLCILIEKEKRKWVAAFNGLDEEEILSRKTKGKWQTKKIGDSRVDRFISYLVTKGADTTKFLVILALSVIGIELILPIISTIAYVTADPIEYLEWVFYTVLVLFSLVGFFFFAWRFRKARDGYGIKMEFIRGVIFFGLFLALAIVLFIYDSMASINKDWPEYLGPIFLSGLFLVTVGVTVVQTVYSAIQIRYASSSNSTATVTTVASDYYSVEQSPAEVAQKSIKNKKITLITILEDSDYENGFADFLSARFKSQLLLLFSEIIQYQTGVDRRGYDHNRSQDELKLFRGTKVYRMARYFDPKDSLFCGCDPEFSSFILELAKSPDLSVDERVTPTLFDDQKLIIEVVLDHALLLFKKSEAFTILLRKKAETQSLNIATAV